MRQDDADDALALHDGDQTGVAGSVRLPKRRHQHVRGSAYGKPARHDALYVAIAVGAQSVGDGGPCDGADDDLPAKDGEDILQGMNAAVEGVLQGVRGSESGEAAEHHVSHRDRGCRVLRARGVGFALRCQQDGAAHENHPDILQTDACKDEQKASCLADADGRFCA